MIAIQPKIALSHFLHIISHAIWRDLYGLETDIQLATESHDFMEVLAVWFLDQISQLIPDRLIRDYSLVHDFSLVVRGPIDPALTTTKFLSGELLVHNRFDLFELDSPPNRLLKQAVLVTSQLAGLPRHLSRRAAALHTALDEIGSYSPTDFNCAVDRRFIDSGFMPAIEFARRLVAGAGVRSSRSIDLARPFLLKTPDIIEEGIREIVSRGLDEPFRVDKKEVPYPLPENRARPDLRFTNTNTCCVIATGDVKYKWATSWENHRSDLYQAAFFATAAKTERGSAIYFSKCERFPDNRQRPGELTLTQFYWNASSTVDPRDSQSKLISEINQWLTAQTDGR